MRSRVLAGTLVAHLRSLSTRFTNRVLPFAVPAAAFAWLASLAVALRLRDLFTGAHRRAPRVIYGPSAILNIKYWSDALRGRGYASTTAVDVPAVITKREDWDFVREDFGGDGSRAERWRAYRMFAWVLRRGDVLVHFMDLGFLRFTPLEWLEYPLTRLAGRKLIVTSYGGDIAVKGHLGRFEEVTFADYPDLESHAELFTRRVHHSLKWANLAVRNHGLGYFPRFDAVSLSQLAVDTDLWRSERYSAADGRNGAVVVVHAPNHRRIKGTQHLIDAVDELRADGLDVDLRILERRGNDEVRAAVLEADIVGDQFYGGFGLFAIEAMSSGRPVIGNLTMEWLPEEVIAAKVADGFPIVDSGPERLREDLRRLVESPSLRRELGRAGREFAVRHHSYEAVGRTWETLVEHVWRGRPLPPELLPQLEDSWRDD